MKNIFHHSAEFIAKHLPSLKLWRAKHRYHHHLALATLALILAGAGVYTYRHELAQAATFSFTQASTSLGGGGWTGLDTATPLASHSNIDDRTLWSKYSTSTGVTASASGVSLSSVDYAFTDDGATSTVPTAATAGGGFSNGTNSGTAVRGSGAGASVGLTINAGSGTTSKVYCVSGQTFFDGSACTNATASSYTLSGGTYEYIDFKIQNGVTVNVSTGGSQLIIKATGNVTIGGTLSANGGNASLSTLGVAGAGGSTVVGSGGGGGAGIYAGGNMYASGGYSGGGGGGSTGAGGNGGSSSGGARGNGGGGGGGASSYGGGGGGGNGGAGGTGRTGIGAGGAGGTTYITELGGSGGGGGAGAGSVDGTAAGGGGGGYLKIISSGSVSISNTGIIQANGGSGSVGYYAGGGGGSGGTIRVIAGNITNTGTINAIGGAGANGNPGYGGGGGGGGGGGRINLYAPSITSGTTCVAGGMCVTGGTTGTSGTGGTSSSPGTTGTSATYPAGTTYNTSGTFTSAPIDLGGAASFTTLSWTETLNSQTITMKARSSANADMSGATAWGSCSSIAKGANFSTGGCVTDGHRYIQYQATLSTVSPAVTPTLNSVTINYTQVAASGDLTSSKYDIGSEAVISKLTWVASTSTTEWIKFQMRSSADGNTWTNWCGDSTCDASETDYFEDANNGVTITTGHPLRSGTGADADRYFQYKVFLGSGGAATPTLSSVTVQYVVNGPPEVQNATAAQNADGTVTVHFDMRDTDTNDSGAATPGKIISTLQYNSAGCGAGPSWTDATAVIGDAGANTTITAAYPTVASSTITWTPATDWSDKYCATQQIRIKLNDSEGANNFAYSSPASFLLDTTAPVVASTGGFLVDSSVGGAGLAGIKLAATDESMMQYRLCNNADFTADGLNLGAGKCAEWTTLATSPIALATTTTSWNTTLTASSTEVVYVQVRDAYGNVTARTATAPAMPGSLLAADVSNPAADSYGETLSWLSVANAGSYKVYYATTTSSTVAPSAYTLLSSPSLNVYQHTITTATSSAYWYRVAAVNTNGDISNFTALMTEGDVPDSFGTAAADTTAPVISFLTAVNVRNTSAEINFSTNELAIMQVFYGTASCSTPTPITTSYVTGHSVYLTNLSPNTAYYYCARVTDVLGNVSAITPGTVTTFTTIGGPVITNVTERELTDTSALIFWNTSTSSDSKVYYSTVGSSASVNASTPVTGPAVTVVGTDGAYQHQVGLTGLTSGVKYHYKVVSADAGDANLVSTDDNNGQFYSFVTLKDTTPPTITGTSTPVLAPTAAVVVWQTNEPATTQVDYGTASGVYTKGAIDSSSNLSIYHVMTLSSATNNALGSGDNTLVKETPYYYRVTSKDAANNTATATGTFTTPADGNVTVTIVSVRSSADGETKDTTAPSISNVKVSGITPFSAVVSFDTSEAAVSFVDYGKDTSYGDSAGDKVYGTTHTVKLRGLSLGTEYHTKVTAHDKAGNTGTGSDQTFKTTFLSENLKDMAKIENIEQFQKEIEDTIESILPSLVPPFVSKPVVTDITENGATVSFRTNIKSFPVVGFVEDALYDATKENPYAGEVSETTEKATDHKVALVGLKQNTKYRVQARAFSLPKVIGKSADISFTTKAAKISGSIIERKKDSFTVVWTTDEPTSSVVEYKNVATGVTERKTDDAKRTSHSMRIENLPSGTTYAVDISGLNEGGNVVEAGASLTVTTSRDVTAPVISGFKVDNALVPGRTDRIQTIVSWKTDEPANSTTYYEEGAGTAGDTKELINKNEVLDSYVTAHSVILPNLKPGTIYRLKVTSSDDSGNEASFGPRTVITPRQTESITDIIFKNFEDSFKFLRDI